MRNCVSTFDFASKLTTECTEKVSEWQLVRMRVWEYMNCSITWRCITASHLSDNGCNVRFEYALNNNWKIILCMLTPMHGSLDWTSWFCLRVAVKLHVAMTWHLADYLLRTRGVDLAGEIVPPPPPASAPKTVDMACGWRGRRKILVIQLLL